MFTIPTPENYSRNGVGLYVKVLTFVITEVLIDGCSYRIYHKLEAKREMSQNHRNRIDHSAMWGRGLLLIYRKEARTRKS